MKRYLFLLLAITTLSAGTALASSPPVIMQTSSWNVGSTTAGISMTINNQNQKSRSWFEYSTQSNLADAKRAGEMVDNPISGGLGVHATLSGLQPNTTYYFRGFTKNYDGEVYSKISSFRTTAAASTPPSVSFAKAQVSGSDVKLELSCNGAGEEGTCSMMWSTNANMSGERELKGDYIPPSPTGMHFYASFALSSVPDNTHVYFQGVMKTKAGVAKTHIHDQLIRNRPI